MLRIPEAQGNLPHKAPRAVLTRPRSRRTRGNRTDYVVPQVFRRLVDDGLMRRLPCLLLTACGFPDYASRAALRRAADALDVPVLHPRLQKSARASGPCVSVECGGLVEADPPAWCAAREAQALSGLGWAGRGGCEGGVTCALTNCAPTQVFVLTEFQHGQSKCLHCSRSPHAASRPPSAPEARPLAQGHHPRGLATRMPREIATSPHGPKPRSSTPVLLRSRVPAKGSPICRLWPPGLQPAWPGLDASVQARLDARWHRRLRLP